MERTNEQKTLNVFAIIEIVFGVLGLLIGIATLVFGGAVFGNSSQIIEETVATAEDVNKVGGVFLGGGLASIVIAVIQIITGVFMKKAVKDATQYKGAYILVTIGLVLSVIGLIAAVVTKDSQSIVNNVVSVAINGFVFYLLTKIKNSVTA